MSQFNLSKKSIFIILSWAVDKRIVLLNYHYFLLFIQRDLFLCCIIHAILLSSFLMFGFNTSEPISIGHTNFVCLMIILYSSFSKMTYFLRCFEYFLDLNSECFIEIDNEDFIDLSFSRLNLLCYWLIFEIRTILQFHHLPTILFILKRLFFLNLKCLLLKDPSIKFFLWDLLSIIFLKVFLFHLSQLLWREIKVQSTSKLITILESWLIQKGKNHTAFNTKPHLKTIYRLWLNKFNLLEFQAPYK